MENAKVIKSNGKIRSWSLWWSQLLSSAVKLKYVPDSRALWLLLNEANVVGTPGSWDSDQIGEVIWDLLHSIL